MHDFAWTTLGDGASCMSTKPQRCFPITLFHELYLVGAILPFKE